MHAVMWRSQQGAGREALAGDPDEAFTAGLLHDVGAWCSPLASRSVLDRDRRQMRLARSSTSSRRRSASITPRSAAAARGLGLPPRSSRRHACTRDAGPSGARPVWSDGERLVPVTDVAERRIRPRRRAARAGATRGVTAELWQVVITALAEDGALETLGRLEG